VNDVLLKEILLCVYNWLFNKITAQYNYSDTSANEDNSFQNHIC